MWLRNFRLQIVLQISSTKVACTKLTLHYSISPPTMEGGTRAKSPNPDELGVKIPKNRARGERVLVVWRADWGAQAKTGKRQPPAPPVSQCLPLPLRSFKCGSSYFPGTLSDEEQRGSMPKANDPSRERSSFLSSKVSSRRPLKYIRKWMGTYPDEKSHWSISHVRAHIETSRTRHTWNVFVRGRGEVGVTHVVTISTPHRKFISNSVNGRFQKKCALSILCCISFAMRPM